MLISSPSGMPIFRTREISFCLPVNRALNPEYHAEQRHCHTTFLIAYEAPVAPLRIPTHQINLRYRPARELTIDPAPEKPFQTAHLALPER
jgi:hypothetical protein